MRKANYKEAVEADGPRQRQNALAMPDLFSAGRNCGWKLHKLPRTVARDVEQVDF
ncbi:MAG: hypothetical protein ICV68_01045 [Pyrinomonadaceae bacterium]|nr:hypothetical protein [Pyrinomonadaceae bacterium]